MIKIIRIIYIYVDNKVVEKPKYLTFANKEQMETYKSYLIRTKKCRKHIFLI